MSPIHQMRPTSPKNSKSSPNGAKKGVDRAPRAIAARSRMTTAVTMDSVLQRDSYDWLHKRTACQACLERACQCLPNVGRVFGHGDRQVDVGEGGRIVMRPPVRADAYVVGQPSLPKKAARRPGECCRKRDDEQIVGRGGERIGVRLDQIEYVSPDPRLESVALSAWGDVERVVRALFAIRDGAHEGVPSGTSSRRDSRPVWRVGGF